MYPRTILHKKPEVITMTENTGDKTIAKTLWSDTLIDILLVALRKNSTDEQLKDIIKELNTKGYKNNYLEDKVSREIDENAARRVRLLAYK
jgi:hypothetical protein